MTDQTEQAVSIAVQVVSVAIILAGLFGILTEPTPKDPAFLSLHLLHLKIQAGMVGAGLLFMSPERVGRGLMVIIGAWKAKP